MQNAKSIEPCQNVNATAKQQKQQLQQTARQPTVHLHRSALHHIRLDLARRWLQFCESTEYCNSSAATLEILQTTNAQFLFRLHAGDATDEVSFAAIDTPTDIHTSQYICICTYVNAFPQQYSYANCKDTVMYFCVCGFKI